MSEIHATYAHYTFRDQPIVSMFTYFLFFFLSFFSSPLLFYAFSFIDVRAEFFPIQGHIVRYKNNPFFSVINDAGKEIIVLYTGSW
jgi:hypothetical protein